MGHYNMGNYPEELKKRIEDYNAKTLLDLQSGKMNFDEYYQGLEELVAKYEWENRPLESE